ncbi:MAG TPA: UDP-3-O-(3-hydroxymyristoyl)glucosamine N-acyltransferase [Candidatus Cloacimonadota bacterium]|nr:UDP-3-O-(3-hydroxymyristoyl)glucosamine N-acyltransferase [Candidatus Cloacimonadota bacterium]
MKKFKLSLAVKDLVQYTGGEYRGDEGLSFDSVATAEDAVDGSIIFVEQEKYLEASRLSRASLIICSASLAQEFPGRNLLLADKPYLALMTLVSIWLSLESRDYQPEISPLAVISPEAVLGERVSIGAYTVIEAGVRIGEGSRIDSGCFIGEGSTLGRDCHLYAGVKLYDHCSLGERVIIHAGCVIGADGFGFLLVGGKQVKIPQIGIVEIHSDVEIGANSTIDRATLGATIVGEGTKIDNLVQIGHNCVIGKHSILCAQVGLAGSTIVGDYVYLAGQVGAAGHIKIGDRAMVGAQSGISNNIPEDARYLGYPARDANTMKRIMAAQMSLPEIYKSYLRSKK